MSSAASSQGPILLNFLDRYFTTVGLPFWTSIILQWASLFCKRYSEKTVWQIRILPSLKDKTYPVIKRPKLSTFCSQLFSTGMSLQHSRTLIHFARIQKVIAF
jgi:hypothetical protein